MILASVGESPVHAHVARASILLFSFPSRKLIYWYLVRFLLWVLS